jgi:hypothetical protein
MLESAWIFLRTLHTERFRHRSGKSALTFFEPNQQTWNCDQKCLVQQLHSDQHPYGHEHGHSFCFRCCCLVSRARSHHDASPSESSHAGRRQCRHCRESGHQQSQHSFEHRQSGITQWIESEPADSSSYASQLARTGTNATGQQLPIALVVLFRWQPMLLASMPFEILLPILDLVYTSPTLDPTS